ncbi:MAG: CBS domain-containing protein, partial [Caldilinea sp.]|nr:CBS domain-containing protein [Caldilinea sp.]
LMTVPLITVRADAEPAAALRVMLQKQIKRLPVVDSDGRLVGLLGRASLLNWLLGSE